MKLETVQIEATKPMTISCYLCGRQFGTKSFSIHLKTCKQKFNLQQQSKNNAKDKAKSQLLIKIVPQPPKLLDAILANSYNSQLLKNYNQQAYKIYKYDVLPSCKFCERTFNSQSLKVHQKGCDKKPTNRFDYSEFDYSSVDLIFSKPKTLICCVCGRQFGTKSLKIHYPQCLEKFQNDQFLKHRNQKQRKKPPKMTAIQIDLLQSIQIWKDQELQNFNKSMMERFRQQSLVSCINCDRKFNSDSIQKHQKNCVLINGNLNPEGNLKKTQSQKVLHFYQKNFKKPKTLMCYICGRQFGLASLQIHQKSCLNKFNIQQKSKPSKDRKKLPELPVQLQKQNYDLQSVSEWSQQKIKKYNQIIYQIYNKKSLSQCYICLRTFFQQSLPKHLVHCQNNLQKIKLKKSLSQSQKELLTRCDSIKKIKLQSFKNQEDFKKPRVLMCHICGRQFGLTSLVIHLKACEDKFLNEQYLKNRHERKKLPQLPCQLQDNQKFNLSKTQEWKIQTIIQYNKIVSNVYHQKSLSKCYLCQRTFFEQALSKHLKHCQLTAQKLSIQKSKSLTKNQKQIVKKFNSHKILKTLASFDNINSPKQIKPKTLVCHVCGRQFGMTSLCIHLPQCQQKFIICQNKKQIKNRKKLPNLICQINIQQFDIKSAVEWSIQKIQIYNKAAEKVYQNYSLFKCQYCYRSFFQQQLKKHQKYCQRQTLKSLSKQNNLSTEKINLLKKCKSAQEKDFFGDIIKMNQKINKPKSLFCHVCGRQFGSTSLQIHLPKCQQKFMKLQQKKNLQQRKELPLLPEEFKGNQYNLKKVNEWSEQRLKMYNQKAYEIYKRFSLSSCLYCSRSFFHEQLPKHIKNCEKEHLKKKTTFKQNQLLKETNKKINQTECQFFEQNKNLQCQQFIKPILSIGQQKKPTMPIVEEEQIQHSLSSITASPTKQLKLNNYFQQQSESFSLQLIPDEKHTYFSQSKNQKNNIVGSNQKFQKQKENILTQEISPFKTKKQCLKGNSEQLNLNNNKQTEIVCNKTEIVSSFEDLQIFENKQVQTNKKKQCCHCKKKVKQELLNRHLQMCKSNNKMTGYKKSLVNK